MTLFYHFLITNFQLIFNANTKQQQKTTVYHIIQTFVIYFFNILNTILFFIQESLSKNSTSVDVFGLTYQRILEHLIGGFEIFHFSQKQHSTLFSIFSTTKTLFYFPSLYLHLVCFFSFPPKLPAFPIQSKSALEHHQLCR